MENKIVVYFKRNLRFVNEMGAPWIRKYINLKRHQNVKYVASAFGYLGII